LAGWSTVTTRPDGTTPASGDRAATTRECLDEGVERLRASGSETARLDAELLLGHAIGVGRTVILAHPEAPVGADAAAAYRAALDRRATGEPVAYIRGLKEFYGLAFDVDPRVLIPRPETERLVELAGQEVLRRLGAAARGPATPPLRIADVGTGSGAIAVALAVTLRGQRALEHVAIVATEVSPEALRSAIENAVAHAVADRMSFVETDLLPEGVLPFEMILANLPYVRSDALAGLPVATSFEPRIALDGGPDGLAVIGRLLDRLPAALVDDGVALLEIGADQGEAITALVEERLPGWSCVVETDLAGLPRVARIARTTGVSQH
jgi:release factor glutamine methyltransferase